MNYDDYSNYDLYDEECTGQPPDADQSLIVPRRGLEPDSGPDDEPMIVERRGSPADTDSLVFEEDMDECPDEYLDDCDNLDAVILPYLTGSKPGKKKRKTIILAEPLELPDDGRRYIDEETDWNYAPFGGTEKNQKPCVTVEEFIETYLKQE